jgi:ATP-dependent protease HslVU (ClpYQ) peptidase subunit
MLRVREELLGVDDSVYAEFLFARRDVLFMMTLRGEVLPCTRGYAAIGTGAEYAMATIHNLPRLSPEERITRAIMCASAFVPGTVQPPVRMQWAK